MAISTILAHPPFLPSPSPPRLNLRPKPHSFPIIHRRLHHHGHHLHLPFVIPKPPTQIRSSLSTPSFPFIKPLPTPTPLTVTKYAAIAAVAIAFAKQSTRLLLSPFFWVYFSWTWIYWPWFFAATIALYAVYAAFKHSRGEANLLEQTALITGSIAWMTLVPAAHFNGFLEGWPVGFFLVYHYFLFFESTVRRRMYGDLDPRPHDVKWDAKLPAVYSFVFAALVFVGHWMAAMEGKELHLVQGGWANLGIWGMVLMVLFLRYHSVLYLAKYSEKVVVPTAVVQFGPYRWVRHPVYASTIALFAAYCVALRAPLSLGFLVVVCLVYYGRKAAMEEDLMMEAFGERYAEYVSKVRYKLIPLLY